MPRTRKPDQNLRYNGASSSNAIQFIGASDRNYKEVRSTIVKSLRKKAIKEKAVIEESYVDSHRNVAVHLGSRDLKSQITKTGLKATSIIPQTTHPGEATDYMYIKQAEHLMKRSIFGQAIEYLHISLQINPGSKLAQSSLAKCLLLMGDWKQALKSADDVLELDKKYVKAILVKAEALYNTCEFEHALKHFHQGQVLVPDMEEFRLGIQKCRKTIQSALSEFSIQGSETFLNEVGANLEQNYNLSDYHSSSSVKQESLPEILLLKLSQMSRLDLRAPTSISSEIPTFSLMNDRLQEDKEYLSNLAKGFKKEMQPLGRRLDIEVYQEAQEGLSFLEARNEFWKQVESK